MNNNYVNERLVGVAWVRETNECGLSSRWVMGWVGMSIYTIPVKVCSVFIIVAIVLVHRPRNQVMVDSPGNIAAKERS